MEESHIFKRVAASAAVDVIAGNSDILTEILLRLPARSLIRFSVVCRLWFSLISCTRFRLHHCRALSYTSAILPSGIYFYNCLTNLQKIESLPLADSVTSLPLPMHSVMDMIKNRHVKVIQSCNGLLLCGVSSKPVCNINLGFVYNPTTKELQLLPSPYDDELYECVYYNMIFDSEPPYFKVLCLSRASTYYGDFNLSVYVPGRDKSWRSCCRFSPSSGMRYDSGVFWNGAIHWIGERYSMYFDANLEEVVIKEKPPMPQGQCSEKIRYFGEWGGHLHLIQVQSVHAKKFSVLELDKDTWKWSVKYRVHLAKLISAFPEIVQRGQYAFSVLSVIRGVSEEDSILLLTIPGKVVAYNLVRKTTKVVCNLPCEVGDTLHFKPVSAYPYNETFAPVEC